MRVTFAFALLALAGFVVTATAGEPDAKKYTPEIRGRLINPDPSVPLNVCLRQSDSEIRACGYADSSGHFVIPSSGPLHSAQAKSSGIAADAFPSYWLETGRVGATRKLWPVDPVADRFAAIELDCDLARASRDNDAFRSCNVKTGKAFFDTVPLDDTRYRMSRAAKSPVK